MNVRLSVTARVGLLAVCLTLLAGAPLASADGHEKERAIAIAFDDTALEWGACPPMFPAGCEIAVLHGDPAKPNADVFFKVAPGYALPRHWHTSAERMVLVAGRLEVAYEGQDAVVLEPGTYAYGPAKAPHGGRCMSESPCVLFIAFVGPVDSHAAE